MQTTIDYVKYIQYTKNVIARTKYRLTKIGKNRLLYGNHLHLLNAELHIYVF